jgi:hypothetical protein
MKSKLKLIAAFVTISAVASADTIDTNVVNTPNVNAYAASIYQDDTILIATKDSVPLNQSLITDVTFTNLVDSTERLYIDFVSVETYVAPNQKAWAVILPCFEKGNFGRTSVPLIAGGSVYNGDTKVNDAFLNNVAMHTYVDAGCTTVVRLFRGNTSGLGHVNVTIQAHKGKKPIVIVPPVLR